MYGMTQVSVFLAGGVGLGFGACSSLMSLEFGCIGVSLCTLKSGGYLYIYLNTVLEGAGYKLIRVEGYNSNGGYSEHILLQVQCMSRAPQLGR